MSYADFSRVHPAEILSQAFATLPAPFHTLHWWTLSATADHAALDALASERIALPITQTLIPDARIAGTVSVSEEKTVRHVRELTLWWFADLALAIFYVRRPITESGEWASGYFVGAREETDLTDGLPVLEDRAQDHRRRRRMISCVSGSSNVDGLLVPIMQHAPYGTAGVQVWRDVCQFFGRADVYQQLGAPYRRGVLLAGPPGNGKTSIVRWILHQSLERVSSFSAVIWEVSASADWRTLEKLRLWTKRPTLVIVEDVDAVQQSGISRTEFLNFLDGIQTSAGVYVLATTNYPEMLDPALHRRGRFDRLWRVDAPTADERRAYLHAEFAQITPDQIDRVVRATDAWAFATLAELRIIWALAQVEGLSPDAALAAALAEFAKDQRDQQRGAYRWKTRAADQVGFVASTGDREDEER